MDGTIGGLFLLVKGYSGHRKKQGLAMRLGKGGGAAAARYDSFLKLPADLKAETVNPESQ
jgi:hypothetical protein